MLDDGRLTDGQGRTVDFRNTVIVMTSNLGSHLIQEMAHTNDYEAMKTAVMEVVGQHFRPEFINRVDETVVFHPLGREQIRKIAGIQIEHLRQRLEERELTLDISTEALDLLGEAGFDPVYGAIYSTSWRIPWHRRFWPGNSARAIPSRWKPPVAN